MRPKQFNVYLAFCFGLLVGVYVMHRPPSPPQPLFSKRDGFASRTAFHNVSTSQVASYWNAQPCNSRWRFDGVEFGTRLHWDKVMQRKYTVEPHIPDFADFDAWSGKRVLEIGGGMCTTAISFAKAGAHMTIVDLSEESMALCRKRFAIYNLTADIHVGDAQRLLSWLEGAVEAFDLVWSFGVIHHMPHPEHAVAQAYRALKPGGTFKIMMYTKISMKLFWVMHNTQTWNFGDVAMDQLIAHYSEAVEGSPVTYTYTMYDLRQLLHQFTIETMFKAHIFKYDIDKYKQGILQVDAAFQDVSPSRFAQLEEELGWHLCATAIKK